MARTDVHGYEINSIAPAARKLIPTIARHPRHHFNAVLMPGDGVLIMPPVNGVSWWQRIYD